jgi:hypothetical protein
MVLPLLNAGVTPSSVSITWNDGTARSASDHGKGAISGNATGSINYQTGLIQMTPTALPAGGQTYSVAYTLRPPSEEEFHAPLRNVNGSIDVAPAFGGLIPGTVKLEWNLLVDLYEYLSTTPAELQVIRVVDPDQDRPGQWFRRVARSTGHDLWHGELRHWCRSLVTGHHHPHSGGALRRYPDRLDASQQRHCPGVPRSLSSLA